MKMFQGFGKVDLPKLKWRSERRDGKCSGHGRCVGRLESVAGGGQATEPALLAAGCWLLALSERRRLFSVPCAETNQH